MATNDNPLGAFFRGFQGAQQRALQQAQQMEENALTQQLREIQLLNAQRQMQEALKTPEQRAQEALTAQLITQAVQGGGVRAAEPGLQGLDIAIAQALTPQTQTSLDLGQITPQAAIAGLRPVEFETPVPGTGGTFVESPVLRRQEQDRELARIQATADARRAPAGFQYVMTDQGLVPLPKTGVAPAEVTPIKTTGGETLTKTPATRTGAARDLTPNARANILAKAGTAGITSDQIQSRYTGEDGVVDYDKLILDSNKTIANDKSLAAEEKLKQIPPAERAKANGFIAAHKSLSKLVVQAKKLKVEGKEPDVWSRAVSTALEAPPDGIFSSLYQSALGQNLTADEQTKNALSAMVRSAVTKANAGLSQTQAEIANVTQYVPKSTDSVERILQLGSLLEDYLIDQVESITTDPRDWLKQFKEGEVLSVNAATENVPRGTTPPTQSAPIQIKSIRRKQ